MYRKRLIESTFLKAVSAFPAVLLTGPRQSGKTTLVQRLLGKKYDYVSLDEPDVLDFAHEDPRGFLEQCTRPLILDEIQNAPILLPYIKASIDRKKERGRWVLTGSQSFSMMRNVSESLAGRIAVLQLYPFSIAEIRQKNMYFESFSSYLDFLLSETQKLSPARMGVASWLLRGAYPDPLFHKEISPRLWYSSYLQTYINRDVRGNIQNANLNDFTRFVRLLAGRSGQLLNYSSLSREIGVSVPTIKSWVSFLEASSIVYLLYPYHRNFGKRIIKSPKCYFLDTGLLCYLVGLSDEEHLLKGPMAGALFETAVIQEFIKRFSAFESPPGLYFYKSTDGLEVDLLIESALKLYPVEIKLNSTIRSRHFEALDRWLKLTKSKECGLIVSTYKKNVLIRANIRNRHFSLL